MAARTKVAQPGIFAGERSLSGRLLDLVFGYVISYAWSDGGHYAEQLGRRLKGRGYEAFLDRDDYASGDNWRVFGRWTLKQTGQLILVGSPAALVSQPVREELQLLQRTGRRIVPIDFQGSLTGLAGDRVVHGGVSIEGGRVPIARLLSITGPECQCCKDRRPGGHRHNLTER